MLPEGLSQEDVEGYQRDGVVVLRAAFSGAWIDTLARGLARNIAEPGPYRGDYTKDGGPGRFFGDYCNWRRISEYEDFARDSPAADIARALMGSAKVNFFHEHVVVKEPGKAYGSNMLWLPKDKVRAATVREALQFWDVERGDPVLRKLWDETETHKRNRGQNEDKGEL